MERESFRKGGDAGGVAKNRAGSSPESGCGGGGVGSTRRSECGNRPEESGSMLVP